MKISSLFLLGTLAMAGLSAATFATQPTPAMTEAPTAPATVYDYTVKTIEGKDVKLNQYKGKKLLIVNT